MNHRMITLVGALLTGAVMTFGTIAHGTPDVVEMIEIDLAYDPDELTINLGQTVRISNQDPFFHQTRISQLNDDGSPGKIVLAEKIEKKNTSQDFTPSHKGSYQLRCMVHDGMESTITVR